MSIEYKETAPLEQIFYTPRGDRAAGYWLFFYDSQTYPTLRDAWFHESGVWRVLPNPVQLNNAGEIGVRVFYKVEDTDPLDKYVLEIKQSNDVSSVAIEQYPDVPRAFSTSDITPINIAGYPPISSGDPGDILTVEIDGSTGDKVGVFSPPADSLTPLYGSCNAVLFGLAVSVVSPGPGTSITVSAGRALFVTVDANLVVSSVSPVSFVGVPSLAVPTATTGKYSYVYANSDGSITTSSVLNANTTSGTIILLAVLEHLDNVIHLVSPKAYNAVALPKQIADLYDSVLSAYSTAVPSKNASASKLDLSGGTFYNRGVGAPDYTRYSSKSVTGGSSVPVYLRSFNDTQTTQTGNLDATVLVKDDGTAIKAGNIAFFPIFQNATSALVIQRTNDDFETDEIPQFEEWLDSFQIAPSLTHDYALIGGIKYVGGTALSAAGNSVFRVDSNGRRLADVTTETQVPTLPADGSMAGRLVKADDTGKSYVLSKFRLNDAIDPSATENLTLTYDVATDVALFKKFPSTTITPTNPAILTFDRPYSYVYQDNGILKQRKSTDNVPLLISQFMDFSRYNGNYIFDISRGYSSTFVENNAADGAARHLRIDDVITNVDSPIDMTKIVPFTLIETQVAQSQFFGAKYTFGVSPASSYAIDAGYNLDASNYIYTRLSDPSGALSTIQVGHAVLGVLKIGPVDESVQPQYYASTSNQYGDQYNLTSSSIETSISSQNTTTNPITFLYSSSKVDIGQFPRQYSAVGLVAVWKTAVAPVAFDITVTCNIKIDGDFITLGGGVPTNSKISVYAIDIFIPNADNTTIPAFDTNLSSSTFTAGMQFLLVYNIGTPNSNITSIDICSYAPAIKTTTVLRSFTAVSELLDFFKNTGISLKSKFSSITTTTYSDPRYAVAGAKYIYVAMRSIPYATTNPLPGTPTAGTPLLDILYSSSVVYKFAISTNITIDGVISDTSNHIRIDFGLLKSFNSAVTTGDFKKGDRPDDIVIGVIHLVLMVVKKDTGTAVPKLEFNPHSIRPNIPQLAIWVSSSQQVICDLNAIEVQRCIYSVNVTQTLLDSGIVACRFYGGVTHADIGNYDISIGVLNRASSN